MIERLAIIGVGLIGGSLAMALHKSHFVNEVIGFDLDNHQLRQAQNLGVLDQVASDPCEAVREADIVVLAVPVGAVESVCLHIRDCLQASTILTDVGSVKGGVIRAVKMGLGFLPENFVPAHPIAGKERSGVAAASADLFVGRKVIITPLSRTAGEAKERVRRLWEATGSRVEEMAVDHHDRVLAVTSHLPHLLAYTLVNSLVHLGEADEIFRYGAGGLRDFTRIASSDPIMWRDICLYNADSILEILDHFEADLHEVRQAIESSDGDAMLDIFQSAKTAREQFCS